MSYETDIDENDLFSSTIGLCVSNIFAGASLDCFCISGTGLHTSVQLGEKQRKIRGSEEFSVKFLQTENVYACLST